jgi:ABC-type glycerol-3-phosphate transport system permease component
VSAAPVVTLSIVYAVLVVDFMAAYMVVRLRISWRRRTVALVLVLTAAVQLAGFLFLILAGTRGWVP